jgi:hypothetical protein
VARIAAFLEERQGGPLPANVRRSLDEWQALHYRIVVHRNACVAQFADDGARDGAREALAPLRLRWAPLGSRADIIERGRATSPGGDPGSSGGSLAERVTATLVEAGWMPLVSPAGADDTAACLRIAPHGDGSDAFDVLFRQAVPSLFALSQLAPFTARDPAAPHRLQLTPTSLRAALSAGASLPQVLTTLAHLHDGPLPPALENAARAWARFYGQAAVRAVSLFEFTSAEVLNNLLDDDAVSGYLSPIDGSAKPLAAVAAEDSDLVRALLAERGIQVAA